MKDEKVWEVLGIEPGSAEEIIRNAYRIKLADTNPEDDPEGFKILREAYEKAIEIINRPAEEQAPVEEEDDSPEGLLIKKVEELYFDVLRRNDPEAWKDIFDDPLIEGLDTVDEVRRRFLRFTMSHYVYSTDMWKALDEIFRFVDEQAALSEEFPPDFISYIVERIVDGDYFVYTETTTADDPLCSIIRSYPIERLGETQDEEMDCKEDVYIRSIAALLPLYASIDNKYSSDEEKEACRKELADRLVLAREYKVFHPFEGVGLMLYYYVSGEFDKALEIAGYYISDERIDSFDNFSVAYAAHIAMENCIRNDVAPTGFDKLRKRLEDIVANNRKFNMAHFALSQLLNLEGDYVNSSEHILNASEFNEASIEIDEFMNKNDKSLVEYYKKRIDGPEASDSDVIELGWCLLRDESIPNEEITNMLDKIKPEGELEYNYYNLYARCLVKEDNFAKADPYVRRWHELLLEIQERYEKYGDEDFTDEEKKRLSRVGYSYYLMALCDGEKDRKEEAEKNYRAAIDFAESKNDKVIFRKVLGEYFRKEGMFDKGFDVWNEIIEIEPRFTYAYIMRQEAAYKTYRARQVINDFFDIIGFAPEYKMAYVYAAKVFNNYNQSEDLAKVIEKAEENGAVSPQLMFEKARGLRKDENNEEAVKLYEELEADFLKENEEKAEAEKNAEIGEAEGTEAEKAEAADAEAKQSENEEEEGKIEDKAAFYADYGYCLYDYAKQLLRQGDTEEERKKYKEMHDEVIDKAWSCINKGLDANKMNMHVHWLLTDILEHKHIDAEGEYNNMKELFPNDSSVDYEYGCYLERMGKKKEAVEQFISATRKDPEHQDAYGKLTDHFIDEYAKTEDKADYDTAIGYIERQIEACDDAFYRIKQALAYIDGYEFEKALDAAELAVKHEPDNIFSYNAKGYALMMMDRLEEAEEAFKTGLSYMKTPRRTALQSNLVYCLERQYKYKEAYEVYAEFCSNFNMDSKDNKERKAKLLKRMEDYEGAEELYGQCFDECAAKYLASESKDFPKADRFKLYKVTSKAKAADNNRDDMADLQLTMMDMYVLSGNKKRFEELSEDTTKFAEKELGRNGIERLLKKDKLDSALKEEIQDRVSAVQMVGMQMLYVSRNYKLAERCLELAAKLIEFFKDDEEAKYSFNWSALVYMRYAESCYRNGHKDKAAAAAKRGLEFLNSGKKSLEQHLDYPAQRPRRLSEVAKLYFFMGERDKAYELIDQMSRCGLCSDNNGERYGLCSDCHERKCYEVYLTLAKFAELEDNYKLALDYYKKAHDITADDSEVEIAIEVLSRK